MDQIEDVDAHLSSSTRFDLAYLRQTITPLTGLSSFDVNAEASDFGYTYVLPYGSLITHPLAISTTRMRPPYVLELSSVVLSSGATPPDQGPPSLSSERESQCWKINAELSS